MSSNVVSCSLIDDCQQCINVRMHVRIHFNNIVLHNILYTRELQMLRIVGSIRSESVEVNVARHFEPVLSE